MIISIQRSTTPTSSTTTQPYGLEPFFFRHALRMALAVLSPTLLIWLLVTSHAIDPDWLLRTGTGRLFQTLFGHWVCPLILWFFATSLSYLIAKWRLLQSERHVTILLANQVLPRAPQQSVPGEVGPDIYQRIYAQLRSLAPKTTPNNLLLVRLRGEMIDRANTKEEDISENELARMQASYALPRYVVWAIPMWGLIGTVVGISESVSHFSRAMNEGGQSGGVAAALQQHLPMVTGGLASAFDATFVALLLSLPVMLLITWLEKEEESYHIELRAQWQRVQPLIAKARAPVTAETDITAVTSLLDPAPPEAVQTDRDRLSEELRLLVLQVKALQETMNDLRESKSILP